METFKKYADYYDFLYQDKDYEKECDFLEKIFRKYSKESIHNVIDLGCGSGGHSLILAKRGYKMTGIDLSPQMIKIANKKARDKKIKINFIKSDIKKVNLKKVYDAAISMFAVISYQITDKDITSAFLAVAKHLKKGGIFVFDFWFGPAVLIQKPQQRFKIIKNRDKRIIRFAFPNLNQAEHTVSVNFKIIKLSKNKVIDEINEIHTMRFFFQKEIESCLRKSGFKIIKICPFGNLNRTLSIKDWNATVIAKKL